MTENAAIKDMKKYSKANHRLGIIFLNPNNGNKKVKPKSRVTQITIENVFSKRKLEDNKYRDPITARKIVNARPKEFAILSIKGGSNPSDANIASGLCKKSAYPKI